MYLPFTNLFQEAIEKHKNKEVEQKDFIYLFLEEIYANKDPTFTGRLTYLWYRIILNQYSAF